MATTDLPSAPQWSELPTELLFVVSHFLESEIDYLRLRSVCSPWRSSIPPRPRKISFPLKLPIPPHDSDFFDSSDIVNCYLEETTFYRLSLPTHTADSSNSWLFRVLETNPNTFALKHPLLPDLCFYPPGVLPKQLNLLDYRTSEICRCYSLKLVNGTTTSSTGDNVWTFKAIFFRDFAALVICFFGRMSYWRIGDDDWTPIDIKDFHIHDFTLYQGKLYVVNNESGELVSFDSEFNMSVVAPLPAAPDDCCPSELVEFGSELYMVSRSYPPNNLEVTVSKLDKCNTKWVPVADLGDAVLVLSFAASFSVSAKDFQGCKGNRVYLVYDDDCDIGLDYSCVYFLNEGRSLVLPLAEDLCKMFLPGSWLSAATS